MIPQWVRKYGLYIILGAYVGHYVGMHANHTDWLERLFPILVLILFIGILWWINRSES